MKLAFLGLGNMGQPMARNLLRAGHELTVWNRSAGRAEALVDQGARWAATPAEAAAAEVVVTMLADDPALEQVVFGAGGLLGALPKDAVHLSMSTVSVAISRRLAEAHRERGQLYVAAPVFGRPEAADAAKLTIVAAGPPHAIERCRPLFDVLGQRTFVVGDDAPAANVVKVAGNFLIASVIECLGEAFALARKNGIAADKFLEIVTDTMFASPVYKGYGATIVGQKYRPAGFRLALGLKDVKLALAAAESASVPMPVASVIRDHALTAMARGLADADWAALAEVAAENAGLK